MSLLCLILRGGLFASHKTLEMGLVLKTLMLSRIPWFWIGFNELSIELGAAPYIMAL